LRRNILIAVGAIAGLAALYVGIMWLTLWRFQVSTDNAAVQADIATIAPKLSGYVAEVNVADNQAVRRGDVLMTLDTSDILPRVDQARATVDAKKAAIKNIDAKSILQRAMIAQAQASVVSAQADAARGGKDLTRYQRLARRGYASSQKLEMTRADADRFTAAVTHARAALEAERDQIGVIETSKVQAQADLEQAEAQLALAQSDLTNAKIVAPIAGVVGNRTVRTGQYVRAGAQVMAIVPLPLVYVVANFKETQVSAMRRGQVVAISIDALPGMAFEGRVDSFAPASGSLFSLLPPENATGNYTKIVQRIPVKIAVEGDIAKIALLRPGMSAGVVIDTRDAGEREPIPAKSGPQNADAQH
jgi:membrane fusion protein (multidrug efflux system)